MEFDLNRLTDQIARHLAPRLEGFHFYENPTQQGVKMPCLFIQGEEGEPDLWPGDGQLRQVTVRLTYRDKVHTTEWMERARQVAEILDDALSTVEYRDREGASALLRVGARRWEAADQELVYRLSLHLRLRRREDSPLMGRIDWQTTWKMDEGE